MAERSSVEAILLDALYSGNGPQHILDTASELLGKPMILVDHANIIIAQTRGATPIAKYLDVNNDKAALRNLDEPQCIIDLGNGQRMLLSAIEIRGQLFARLGIYEKQEQFTPDIGDFAQMLGKVLAIELRGGSGRYLNAMSANRLFLLDILEQRLNTDEIIANRLKDISWVPKDEFVVFAFPLRGNNFSAFVLENIQEKLCSLIPNSLFVANEAGMTVLTTIEASKPLSVDMLSNLSVFLQSVGLRGGMSARYSKLYETHYALEQAFTAMEMAEKMRRTKPLSTYEECAIYHMLDYCSWKIKLRTLCMPGIARLEAYDRTHTTKLMGTLRSYLDHAQDINKTAEDLCIHRNTLTYRLEKLKEILDTEFDNGYDIMRLNLSFQILDYLEKIS